jgi:hypothetical protein
LHYDPETGVFTWLVDRGVTPTAGRVAGTLSDRGYWVIFVEGRNYRAHRLAWFYMTGEWPVFEIDHRDTKRTNNRWKNLREATRSQNMSNSNRRSDNKSGVKGVVAHGPKWRAQIKARGRYIYLGTYDRKDDAVAAYAAAAQKHHGDFARVA